MALINRISRLFKADFHSVLDKIEEPEQLLKQAIRDMEGELANAEQRVTSCAHHQDALSVRKGELKNTVAEIDAQLDLCFESGEDELAKSQIKKKLGAENLLKHLSTKHASNKKTLEEQRTTLEENRATLESLRQKAELFAQRAPGESGRNSELGDLSWTARDLTIDDDEIEIAYLREKNARKAS